MSTQADRIKKFYETFYENYWLAAYKASLKGEEISEGEGFLEKEAFDFYSTPEKINELPESVIAAYNYYHTDSIGYARVCEISCDDVLTYAVCDLTDGDDGWLEIYDISGSKIAAGRTYIELISWCKIEEIRSQARTSEFPPDLVDRRTRTFWQFGSMVIRKDSPERFIVGLEKFPVENEQDIVKAICASTGMSEIAVEIVLDCLPHPVTKNISRENAEELWRSLLGLGAKATIKESTSGGWVLVQDSSDGDSHA
jgi:hypothetical protein